MNSDISGYEGIINDFFQGKKCEFSDISGGVSYDIKIKVSCEGKDWIVKIIEGNAPNPGEPQKRFLWYQALDRIRRENDWMLSPEKFGVANGHVVTATKWIYGKQLDEVFVTDPELMVPFGKEAGKMVRTLHNQEFVKTALKENNISVVSAVEALVAKLINEIRANNISFDGMDKAIEYLNDNLSLISDDRAGVVHDDLRPENFILSDDNIYLYDFDSGKTMDYYADFTYLSVMSNSRYRAFSYGLIMSYFDSDIPDEFWKVNLFFSILKLLDYAIYKFHKKGTMVIKQAENYNSVFDDYKTAVPTWWVEMDKAYRNEYLK